MTIHEYIEYLLQGKKELKAQPLTVPESKAVEAAQLVSGSFTYLFYETIWLNDYPMETLTAHLEALYDRGDHHGFIYFIILLADSTDFRLPAKLYEMSISDTLISPLSAAIIEDWLEYDILPCRVASRRRRSTVPAARSPACSKAAQRLNT